MTLERLVQIVVEIVEKTMILQKLQVGVCICDKANTEHTREYARTVNGECHIFSPGNIVKEDVCVPCDILFVDFLPARYLAKLALYVCDDQFSLCINETVLRGGTVFVLNSENSLHKNTPAACIELLKKYMKMLESYGYVFLNYGGTIPEITGSAETSESSYTYRKNVLTRADLLPLASNSVVTVASSVLITDLARETARYRNIEIIRI